MRKKYLLLIILSVICTFSFFSAKEAKADNMGGLYVTVVVDDGTADGGAAITNAYVEAWGDASKSYDYLGLGLVGCNGYSFAWDGATSGLHGAYKRTGYTNGSGQIRFASGFTSSGPFKDPPNEVWGTSCGCNVFSATASKSNYNSGGKQQTLTQGDNEIRIKLTSSTPAPTCNSFTASPNPISVGNSTTLTWDTSNASSATLNGSPVSVDGSTSKSPTSTTTYTLSLSGPGGSGSCNRTVTVKQLPSCTNALEHFITGSKIASGTTLQSGYEMTTAWHGDANTTHVKWTLSKDGVCINGYNGVYGTGACSDSSGYSTNYSNPGPDPKWTLEPGNYKSELKLANGLGGISTCTNNYPVIAPPDLTLSADPLTINDPSSGVAPSSTALTWTPSNATWCWAWAEPGRPVWGGPPNNHPLVANGNFLDSSNGAHSLNDSPDQPTTYKMKCGNGLTETPEKSVTVDVVQKPTCRLSASPNPVTQLFPAVLSWNISADATSASINPAVSGTIERPSGSRSIITRDPGDILYTMTVGKPGVSGGTLEGTCSATLNVKPNTESGVGPVAP